MWKEQDNNNVMINLKNPKNIEARCKAAVEEDGIVTRKCKECGAIYGYPTKNPYGQSKFGPDDGICPGCKGMYDDPEEYIKMG